MSISGNMRKYLQLFQEDQSCHSEVEESPKPVEINIEPNPFHQLNETKKFNINDEVCVDPKQLVDESEWKAVIKEFTQTGQYVLVEHNESGLLAYYHLSNLRKNK